MNTTMNYSVKLISKENKDDVYEVDMNYFIKLLKEDPYYLEEYSFKVIEKEMRDYRFRAVIHPKGTGDDYVTNYVVNSVSLEEAKKGLEKALKKISSVIDYIQID